MSLFRHLVTIDGKEITVWAQKIKGDLWVHYQGETFCLAQDNSNQFSQTGAQIQNPLIIKAPMPGKITSIKVNVGDTIESGFVALVMEAMKMEYSLTSHQKCKVKSINIKTGDLVSLGQTLIEFQEST